MTYEIDLQPRETYMRVRVRGTRRYGDAALDAGIAGEKIVAACRAAGIHRVLVILELRGRLSAIDSYEMVSNSRDYGWSHDFRLAFVVPRGESAEDVRFTETVAVNRAYPVKVFTDENAAVDWLHADAG